MKISTDGVTASVYYVKREQNALTYSQNGIPLSEEKKETTVRIQDHDMMRMHHEKHTHNLLGLPFLHSLKIDFPFGIITIYSPINTHLIEFPGSLSG